MWRCGIPLAKLDIPEFRKLVEEPHAALGGRAGVREQMPAALAVLDVEVKEAVAGRFVSVFFDGSKVNEQVEAVIVRFVMDDLRLRHLCIGLSMVNLNMTGNTLLKALRVHLDAAGVAASHIVAATSDSASVNVKMADLWNEDVRTFSNDMSECLLWIGCISHGLSNCGTTLRKSAGAELKSFFHGYKKMTNTSSAARKLWKEVTGARCQALADNRWWAWYDCAVAVLNCWERVPGFLAAAAKREIAKKSVERMVKSCSVTLELQIRACVLFGKQFRDGCVLLEGDGFSLPFVVKIVRSLRDLMEAVQKQKERHPIFQDLRQTAINRSYLQGAADQEVTRLFPGVWAAMRHYHDSIWTRLDGQLFSLYDAASLFNPLTLCELKDAPEWGKKLQQHFARLVELKGIENAASLSTRLTAELAEYETQAGLFLAHVQAKPNDLNPEFLWEWWCQRRVQLPAWFGVARVLCLIQPSSAVMERFFSTIKSQTSAQQNAEYEDTLQGRARAIFNHE